MGAFTGHWQVSKEYTALLNSDQSIVGKGSCHEEQMGFDARTSADVKTRTWIH